MCLEGIVILCLVKVQKITEFLCFSAKHKTALGSQFLVSHGDCYEVSHGVSPCALSAVYDFYTLYTTLLSTLYTTELPGQLKIDIGLSRRVR